MSRSNSTLLMLVFAGLVSAGAASAAQGTVTRLNSAPVPADPHEPVTGGIRTALTPAERGDALTLLERARQNGLSHRGGFPPFRLDAAFTAGGAVTYTGQGQLTETWLSGRKWLWTATLGAYSMTRSVGYGTSTGDPDAAPLRIHMLRNAIFWAERPITERQIRTASVQLDGRPATCILTSRIPNATDATRLWEEAEYCVDNASGVLRVESIVPGTYYVYDYGKGLSFHGQAAPDRIQIYVNGAQALDAQLGLVDAGQVDDGSVQPTPDMKAAGPAPTLVTWQRFALMLESASVSGPARPVVVHASVNAKGKVTEQEVSSAADASVAQAAMEKVASMPFGANTVRQLYIIVWVVGGASTA